MNFTLHRHINLDASAISLFDSEHKISSIAKQRQPIISNKTRINPACPSAINRPFWLQLTGGKHARRRSFFLQWTAYGCRGWGDDSQPKLTWLQRQKIFRQIFWRISPAHFSSERCPAGFARDTDGLPLDDNVSRSGLQSRVVVPFGFHSGEHWHSDCWQQYSCCS
jgi:hypothetical protein